jgi:FkbM family methyltransferase
LRVRQAIAGYQEREIVREFAERITLTVSIQDPLGEGWYESEPQHPYPEIEAASDHGLEPGATVFDIGAHQAVVALVLAHIVGPGGHVVAVEGDRHNVKVARRNVELNGVGNLSIVCAACTDHSGTVDFHEGLNGGISEGRLGNHLTRAVTIDELAQTHGAPDVVYLDIEGHELAALRGAARAISNGSTFVIEVHASGELQDAGGCVTEIVEILEAANYQFLFLPAEEWSSAGSMRRVDPLDLPHDERFFLLAYARDCHISCGEDVI